MIAGLRAELRLAALPPLLAEAEAAGSDWLGGEERARLRAMASEKRRQQFLAGHWLARRLAAEVFGGEPGAWVLGAAPDGAPLLRSPSNHEGSDVAVSLSHSGAWVAAAVAPFAVGLDIECEGKARDLLALAENVFSPAECELLRSLPESDRAAVFYQRWTVKEAVGKREGHGLRPELARRQQQVHCGAQEAEVFAWHFDGCSLALAGQAGMSVRAVGIPSGASQEFLRIESATA